MPRYGCAECLTAWTAHDHSGRPERCPECGTGEVFVDKPHGEPADLYDRMVSVLANQAVDALSISVSGAAITASAPSRTLSGPLVKYGVYGRTSRGRLKVRAGALRFPDDTTRVKLTKEHDRAAARGHLSGLTFEPDGIRASTRVSDGPEGDAALQEAADHTRDAFSFDVIDATIDGDEITDALVIAIGQVGIPAYDDARIDTIAASNKTGDGMNKEQRARLAWLRALDTRTAEQEKDFTELVALEAANPETPPAEAPAPAAAAPAAPAAPAPAAGTQQVAASMPAVPGGVPGPTAPTKTQPQGGALGAWAKAVCDAVREQKSVVSVTAALEDIVYSDHGANISVPAWSGELWSGVQYESIWTPLFGSDTMTALKGRGWRFVVKPEIEDYAGDKAEIPSNEIETEDSEWTGARMAVGHDFDRAFFDFPNEGFLTGYAAAVRESWAIKLDAKVRAYALANVHAATRTATVATTNADATVTAAAGTFSAADVGATITGTGIPAATTILTVTNSGSIELSANATATGSITATIGVQKPTVLKAAAAAIRDLKRRRVGKATFLALNSEDMDTLLDVNEKDVPMWLELWGVDPSKFVDDDLIPRGTVMAGVRQTATVRTLPGSPIRVDAQNLTRGGVDDAFFGYWAIEEHHTSGIAAVQFNPAA